MGAFFVIIFFVIPPIFRNFAYHNTNLLQRYKNYLKQQTVLFKNQDGRNKRCSDLRVDNARYQGTKILTYIYING